jgi:flavin-dependent dehydrogenase
MRRAPPLIIGGGPAGAAAAIALAATEHAVTLIERHTGPSDKVCGDFLSTEAIAAVAECGIDLAALTPASITGVRIIHGSRVANARLPFNAFGLTRRTLDEALLKQAQSRGVTVLRGQAARSVTTIDSMLQIDCSAWGKIATDTVFLATGKHEVRGASRGVRNNTLVGLKMYYTLDPGQAAALRHHVELVLFPGGYAGLQPVEGDRAVLCALLPADRARGAAAIDRLVADSPHLAERLSGARALLDRPLAVAGLPYGYVHTAAHNDPPGLFRLGDQAAVIASLTGDGVALALASGTLAARTWLRGGNAAAYHRNYAGRLARQMRLANAIHRLCLSRPAQRWVVAACQLWPAAIRLAADWTRSGTISPIDV